MKYHEDIVDYMKRRGVSVIFLFRRNLLRRMISLLANIFDKDAKLLNGTHKSHVHSTHDVRNKCLFLPVFIMFVFRYDSRHSDYYLDEEETFMVIETTCW